MYYIYGTYIENISNIFYFSFFVAYLFSFIIMSFGEQKFLILLKSNLSTYSYGYCLLCPILESLSTPRSWRNFYKLSSGRLIVLPFIFRSVIHLDYLFLFFSFFLLHHKQPYLGEKSQDRWVIDPKVEKIFLLPACLQLQHEQSRLSQSDDPAWDELAVPQGHRENQREFTGALREPRVQKYRGEFLGQGNPMAQTSWLLAIMSGGILSRLMSVALVVQVFSVVLQPSYRFCDLPNILPINFLFLLQLTQVLFEIKNSVWQKQQDQNPTKCQ